MKIYIKSDSHNGYLYIFKHGTGPGTIPKDVVFLKEKDLPNGYTAVWLDRFLRTYELKAYDIPSETEINRYLDRIGYCQKNDDVVPCDDIEACGDIKASTSRDIELLAREALNCNTKEELSQVIGSLLSIDKKLYLHYMELLRDDSLSVAYIASQLSDELMSYYDNVDACDKITASTHRYSVGCIEEDGTEDFYYDTGFDSYDEAFDWGTNHDCTHIYDREKDEFIPINSCDTKYFANMISASDDSYRYLIRGYYDQSRRGLAKDSWADTISEVDEIVNEYANKGYYLEVRNLETGTVLEFSADNWFDEIYPDGGFSAIPGAID